MRILRSDGTKVGLKEQFSILDADDVMGVLRDAGGAGGDAAKAEGRGLQQFAGQLQHTLADDAGAQQQGQQFGVAQGLRAARQQFFAWPLGGRPVGDFHEWIRSRWWPTD